MKAVSYTRHGPARDILEYGDLPVPTPDDGEVLIKIHSSGVNPSDVKARAGLLWPMTAPRTVPHNDGAGVIVEVGKGVDKARIGERVWTYNVNRTGNGMGQGANGTAAEYTAVKSALAVPLPDQIGFIAAAALGVPAMTAHAALLTDGSVKDMSVLVTGGAGAVGAMAIQIAKWAGASRIVTTVSSNAKAEISRQDGADATVNYKAAATPDALADALLDANGGAKFHRLVDVDFGTYINLAAKILHHNGVISCYASMTQPRPTIEFYPLMMNGILIRMIEIYALPPERFEVTYSGVNRVLEDGALTPRIDRVYPLTDIVAAHERVETGSQIGNVIVEV